MISTGLNSCECRILTNPAGQANLRLSRIRFPEGIAEICEISGQGPRSAGILGILQSCHNPTIILQVGSNEMFSVEVK
jgi:hypothetical protein